MALLSTGTIRGVRDCGSKVMPGSREGMFGFRMVFKGWNTVDHPLTAPPGNWLYLYVCRNCHIAACCHLSETRLRSGLIRMCVDDQQ